MKPGAEGIGSIVAHVVRALDELGIAHMVTGSLAVSVHATPRATKDADLVVHADSFDAGRLASVLGSGFRLERQAMFETITMSYRHVIEHVESGFLIELFALTDDPHDVARFGRRLGLSVFGVSTAVATAEDVVITKLRWSRIAARGKDLDDARNVLAVQSGSLDLGYVRRWCREHGTEGLLDGLLAELP